MIATAGWASPGPAPQFVTLGTGGGPVVQLERSQPANAVVVNGAVYLLDVGEGTQRQLMAAGLSLANVRAVFLSHHHLDHVGGLWPMMINRWINRYPAALPIVGPAGTNEMVAGLVGAAKPVERAPLAIGGGVTRSIGLTVAPREIADKIEQPLEIYRDENIRVLAIGVDHFHQADGSVSEAARSYAFRVEAGGRSMVFSGDTGPSPSLEQLARNADLLVCEVMDRDAVAAVLARMKLTPGDRAAFMRHIDLDHLTAEQVGSIASRAGVKSLVLTHFAPGRTDADDRKDIKRAATEYRGPIAAAHDGQRF